MFPAGIIINYTITVTQEDDNNIIELEVPTSSLRVTLEFEFFVEYDISIVPVNGFGDGESSMIVMTTSPEGGVCVCVYESMHLTSPIFINSLLDILMYY